MASPSCARGFALEAADLRAAAELTEAAKPMTPRSRVGVLGLDVHLAARQGDLVRARQQLALLLPALVDEGYAAPSQVHDLLAATLAAGMSPDEMQPLADLVGVLPEHHVDPEHPFRRLIDAPARRGAGDLEDAALGYSFAAETFEDLTFTLLPRHQGTAHVGAARCLIALGRLDEARPHAEAAADLLSRWRGCARRRPACRAAPARHRRGGGRTGELAPRERRWPRSWRRA